ncbi:unnamed protein product [Brugia timori]|uniref:NADH dehydrogenase [ubiquinone] 1 beta subcomplex subunit 10 n=1 Tax=Brugia timori TaxID=42155 RepID=A0A0R3R3P7_9BILA|nr:unnamed protein product [Brugia timori]
MEEKDKLSPRIYRRMEDKKAWNAYWQLRKLESQGSYYIRLLYYAHKAVDVPVTWFREKIIEPMNDRYRSPYYHRKLNRVPGIDDCAVDDLSCFYEANTQFRLDKLVDQNILDILRLRLSRCMDYNAPNFVPCAKLIDDVEENELNFFIKYGEIGQEGDVRDAYMKQKHRMIWERRHPEIMKARAEACEVSTNIWSTKEELLMASSIILSGRKASGTAIRAEWRCLMLSITANRALKVTNHYRLTGSSTRKLKMTRNSYKRKKRGKAKQQCSVHGNAKFRKGCLSVHFGIRG